MLRTGALETPRLFIRRFAPGDAPALVELFADPEVARFVGSGGPLSAADAALWVERSSANVERHGYGTGAVIERATGALVGWAGFPRPDGQPEEIIYGLARRRWRRGYGRKILGALVAFAGRHQPSLELRATVDRLNAASVRLLDRHGFRLAASDHGGERGVDLYLRPGRRPAPAQEAAGTADVGRPDGAGAG